MSIAILTLTLSAGALPVTAPPDAATFAAYWNQGKAEVTSYRLEQARYGEVHAGTAVLVFVTEPFSAKKHVKLDRPDRAGADHVPVLKLNFVRKFNTGVYPYSMMTSVFAPAAGGEVVKVTSSSQEWCGHTFQQLDRTSSGWRHRLHSYFETEGDQDGALPAARTEDGLWTQIRIDPSRLPTGDLTLIPGTTFLRLRHRPPEAARARATLTREGELVRYTIAYRDLPRTVEITFEPSFPFRIAGFTERGESGFGPGTRTLETTGRVHRRLLTDYWNRHRLEDADLRRELGLD